MSCVADSIPKEGIEFGYCGVNQVSTKSFTLYNPLFNNVKFEIVIDNIPFEFSSLKGLLIPKQKQEIQIKYAPIDARVIIASAIVKFTEGEEGTRVLKIGAVGKYPFLIINQDKIDFDPLIVGNTFQKEIFLKNQSLVTAIFNIEKVNDDGKDVAFSLNCYNGTIPPNASFKVIIKYVPQIVGVVSCNQYLIKTIGGNDLSFACRGEAVGFNVNLNVKSIHFGEVSMGNNTNRLLNINNNSELPTTFQFNADQKNVFSFSKLEGTAVEKSQTRIIVTFTPIQTGNYYERVFCIMRNHQVLYVDLIGTCYDILTKPIPLMQRHIDIYRHKAIMGIHNKQRKLVNNTTIQIQDNVDDKIGQSINNGFSFEEEGVEINMEIPIDNPDSVVLHKEMFLEMNSDLRDLKLREEFIDFSFAECGRLSESKYVTIDNKFPFDVSVNWVLLKVTSTKTGQQYDNPFKFYPESVIIQPNSSQIFSVKFGPFEPDSYFFQVAQCFIQLLNGTQNKVKKMQLGITGNLKQSQKIGNTAGKTLLSTMKKTKYEEAVNEDIDPPACLNLRMVGHSFPPGSQPFIPMIKLSPSNKIVFASAGVNESVYQSIQIVNTSDTPVFYKILQDPTKTFRTFPQVGMINGKSFGIICFEFQPKQARFYNFAAQCVFNHSSSNIQSIHLIGYCYAPQLSLGNNSKLFFPPSFVGVSSKQKLSIKNESRIPLEVECKVPPKYKLEIIFDPQKTYLLPNEEQKIVATFTPQKRKEYIINVPIYAKNMYDHIKNLIGFYNPGSGLLQKQSSSQVLELQDVQKQSTVRYDLEVIGGGSDGMISINPKQIDFGTITVGFSKTLSVEVNNKSNCNLFIELKMASKIENDNGERQPELPQMAKDMNDCFKFDNPKGLINSKTKKKVNITFKPTLRFDFDIHLVCIAKEKPAKEVEAKMLQKEIQLITEKCYINVHAMGDFPLLRFTDVRNDTISTPNLWERFNFTNLNKELLHPLNDSEIEFNNSDKTNQSMNDLLKNLKNFDWDFGKIPIKYGPKPRRITLTIKNIGGVRADWCFKMPNDQEIELEPWADPGEPSDEQAFERHILENKIFQIEPRKGALEPGQQMDLNIYYFPKEIKKHFLKVFFSIQNGKPLILNFQGQTLNRRACLQLLKDVYNLPPVPIGLEWAVTYPIEIKNKGITKLKYQVDTSALEALNQKNYDFRIFEIQNPEGTLMANETQYIYTLFRPLEAKDYSLDLPIKISDIEGPSLDQPILSLRGIGYHFEDKKPLELPFYEDLPKCRANLGDNGSMAAFSIEEIDFGELAKGEVSRRFVILYNLHQTYKLKFEFQKSGLMCGDNIKLEPMCGEMKPNSHQNIKMTLISSRYPTHFEGEIQCSIDWESEDINKQEMKSAHTNTAINESSEYLFLRLRKRSKIDKMQLSVENRDGQLLVENILSDTVHDILESDEFDKLLDDCEKKPTGLFLTQISSDDPPNCNNLQENQYNEDTQFQNQNIYSYEKDLKDFSGMNDQDIFRKRMFMEKNFVDMLEFMLEDTIFNLMEEATYEEFDLTSAPKIYIRKDDPKFNQ